MPISINVTDAVTPRINELLKRTQRPRAMLAACAQELANSLKAHFLERNLRPNQNGWPSGNFWAKEGVQKTAVTSVTDRSATVTVASPAIAFRLRGGTIRPKRGRALALPATAAAAKAGSPRELDDNFLTFQPVRGKGKLIGILVTREHTKLVWGKKGVRKGKTVAGGQLWYYLVSSTDHEADPTVLPKQADLADAILRRAEIHLARAGA